MIQKNSAPIPDELVRERIDEILSRTEFGGRQSALSKWFSDLFEKILDAIGDLFGISSASAGTAVVVIAYVALAVALVWIAWRIVRARGSARSRATEIRELDPVEARRARVADLRRAARKAHEAANYVLALRLYFTALVVGLGEKGDLEYRDAWTNRELLERGEPSEKIERTLSPLVRDLDAKSFGGMVAVDSDVAAMSRVVDDLLGTERA